MVGKVSERVLLREGLERTDNGMKMTTWPDVAAINQKNYYTDYMKRDDQILALRLQNEANRDKLVQNARDRDRVLSKPANGEVPLPIPDLADDEGTATPSNGIDPSKIIVIHPGSQNLRIGFASDALPRTIPMTESEMHEALPRRQFEAKNTDQQYGEEWSKKYNKQCSDLKRKLVQTFNRRTEAEVIQKHNDPLEIEWTDVKSLEDPSSLASCFVGNGALRVPDDSDPKFKLWWPIQHGWWNEEDYTSEEHLYDDFETLLDKTLRQELGLKKNSEWQQYSCVFVIPDLYDKRYVEQVLRSCMTWFEFNRVTFIQESMAATFGAGYTQACVVDVGAQKTSISCAEDGLLAEDSRINLKYGGYDITDTFIKMMLYDNFPYQDINIRRRYDFLLAEELKIKHCTMSQADISVQLYQFHVRAPNQPTRKYQFKTYDEVILAPMGVFDPEIFDNSAKLKGRRKLIDRSYNAYDVEMPDDPASAAQLAILALVQPSITSNANGFPLSQPEISTPMKEKAHPFSFSGRDGVNGTPMGSHAGSPAPEGNSTPAPPFVFANGKDATNGGSPAPPGSRATGTPVPGQTSQASQPPPGMFVDSAARTAKHMAAERDSVLPVAPLDIAILTSIQNAAKGDEKKLRDLLGSIMVIGGGAKVPQFTVVLEEKLKQRRPDLHDRILVSRSARDMDEQVVTWKGASVFAKLSTNDSWITPFEFERHGARTLHHKVLWNCSVSFVISDLIGQKHNIGDVVGTLGFADEVVALVACPAWGLISDRLGVRWVATIGYLIIGASLVVFVQAKNIYPQLLLARIFFAIGASAAEDGDSNQSSRNKHARLSRQSIAFSVNSELTITPERYTRTISSDRVSRGEQDEKKLDKASALAGYVGLATGCGALVALSLFLPLPTKFGDIEKVTPGQAVSYSFYVVAGVAIVVAVFVFFGLRNLRGEEGKGWGVLLGLGSKADEDEFDAHSSRELRKEKVIPYLHLMKDSLLLGVTDKRIAIGYIGGFVARASTVAISLFIPLYINTFFIDNGFCQGSPHDPSPELKKECRTAYILSSILTGVAQLIALICAPVFGYISHKSGQVNWPIVVSTIFGMVGYVVFPQLSSPEIKNEEGRGGTPAIFLVVALIGISQIGAIVCSLGSLGQGVLAVELSRTTPREPSIAPDEDESAEDEPLLRITTQENSVARTKLKGSIAGVYSLCGGAAILLLTKLGGYLFDKLSTGAPFYMMAVFNAILLVVSLMLDASQTFAARS
ncbi:uncharacterized protein F5Z01DRAFT_679882 [Emericellopsis atlantica]|uniref:Actin-related protein 8 n=1 Tax=Emericellopsis atlantica TaxID=2614577 RepID=A0A9P8CRX0_9HYPO|nr:uncharacterized protein F5Z01DRAFT_679882 [Emericellopsis atlantica]KAG9257233.1 hypothetical protein F5Z01DRAFT_679882 [Emericellopsis atlantica]